MTVEFTADSSGYDSYIWDFADGTQGSGKTVSHLFDSVAVYNVKLTVTEEDSSNTDSLTISIWPNADYGKVLCSGVELSHEQGMKTIIESIYPTVSCSVRIESFSSSITWAKQNGYGIISRATTGLSDSRISNYGDLAETWNIIPIHAHADNIYEYSANPSYVGSIWSVRNTTGSFGPGVEFTIPTVTTESDATATMAGYVSKYMDTYSVSIDSLRSLFRSTASNGGVYNDTTGYGIVDWSAVDSILNGE